MPSCQKVEPNNFVNNINEEKKHKRDSFIIIGNFDSSSQNYFTLDTSLYSSLHLNCSNESISLDIDSDGSEDFTFGVYSIWDVYGRDKKGFVQYTVKAKKEFEIVCSSTFSIDLIDTLSMGDTLSNSLIWSEERSQVLYESGDNYIDGNWTIWGRQKYLGFRKVGIDTLRGWLRIGLEYGDRPIRIYDGVIQK